jgi:hypothetical protein
MAIGGGYYKVDNPMNAAMQGMANAASSYSSMTKRTEVEEPGKTAGGAVTAGAGGAAAGAATGAQLGGQVGGYWGAGIGAVVGALAYALS